MNTSDIPVSRMPGSNWLLLGELELPIGTDLEEAISTRLMELLLPLTLHPDFMHRLLISAQNSAAHILQSESDIPADHIHLVVHIPVDHKAKPGTWGFFHVEKTGHGVEETSAIIHSIAFYLYKESYEETDLSRE
jgi:hypothetical protein